MKNKCLPRHRISKIIPLENKCARIHKKIVAVQFEMKKVEKKSKDNLAWRSLLNSAVLGMKEALGDFEKRLDHIRREVKEFR